MLKHSLPITALLLAGLMTPALSVAQHEQHTGHNMDHGTGTASQQPTEAGQDAFAAIQEIVGLLEADPDTDWSRVDIDALRDHLIDMHLVTLYAKVDAEPIDGGARYQVYGEGETIGAIQRMVGAHAGQISTDTDWMATTEERPDGVELTVITDEDSDVARIRGLGFAGFMALGDHHQPHHLMMATGGFSHQH
ncbi:MAG: hypothetical protein ACQETO_00400 [Pseudomonadota bacterium]